MFSRSSLPRHTSPNSPPADAPLKEPCKEVLELASRYTGAFYADAEVLQEMLHRYLSLRRWPEGKQIIGDFETVMRGSEEDVRAGDVVLASELVDRLLGSDSADSPSSAPSTDFRLATRDFLHAAVMMHTGSSRIVSADKDFDELKSEGIIRLDPAEVKHWRTEITDTGHNGA